MVLRPGDTVPYGSCEPVGNFPHGLLTDPDALALDPGAFGASMCLNLKKQDYIDAFEANDLLVCNEGQFATLHSPYILHLERKDEPPGDEIGVDRCIAIYGVTGAYNVIAKGPWTISGQKITSDSWWFSQTQQGMPYFLNEHASGSVIIDFQALGDHTHVKVLGGFYDNIFFLGQLKIEWTVYNINALHISGTRMDVVWTITCGDDAGIISQVYNTSGGLGVVAHYMIGQTHLTVPWGVNGTLQKYIDFTAHIELVQKNSYGYIEDFNPFNPNP